MTDDARIDARIAAGVRSGELTAGAVHGFRETVDGRRHPELFLQFEVFDDLLTGLEPASHRYSRVRKAVETVAPQLGLRADRFWADVAVSRGGCYWLPPWHASFALS